MNMKKRLVIAALCLGLVFAIMGNAMAKDIILEATISGVTEAVDRNGNTYIRAIVNEPRELDGIKYAAGVPLMFFGDSVAVGKTLKDGDKIKAIVSPRYFEGRKSFTYLKAVE